MPVEVSDPSPYRVFVSSVPLRVQLQRLEDGLPQVRELVQATCPQDPRHDGYVEMERATTQAITWLREALA